MSPNLNCKRCRGEKLEDEFALCENCRSVKRLWAKKNPEKNRVQSTEWRIANPDKAKEIQRRANLKRAYGISIEQYEELEEKQEHKCAVCDRHKSEFKSRLAVDHDHKTGEIFGLLCTYCNHRVIGRERNPERFYRAAEYLSKGTGWIVPPKKKRKKNARRPRRKD